jgi:hypothetical protein
MELSGEARIAAPRAKVWAALNDPALLARAIEGCESLEPAGENRFEGVVAARVGPVRAKFGGVVELSNLDPPNGYTLSGEGKGGAAGFARGAADIRLEDAEDGAATRLTWTARATVGGKLAQLGARLIEGAAKAQAEKFFTAFKAEVEQPATEKVAAPANGRDALDADRSAARASDSPARPAATVLAENAGPPMAPRGGRPASGADHGGTNMARDQDVPPKGGLSLTSWSIVLIVAVVALLAALLLFDR